MKRYQATLSMFLTFTCFLLVSFPPSAGAGTDFRDAVHLETANSVGFTRQELRTIHRSAQNLEPLNSLLISRRSQSIMDYYDGLNPGEGVNIKSASKSVISALTGIAIEQGHLKGIDQPLVEYFPSILKNAPEAKQTITIRNLLLMQAGLRSTSFENYGAWVTSDNWLRYALNQPLVEPPGTVANYSTGNSHIVASILTRVTDRDLRNFAQDHLFDPLGVRVRSWQRSPEGYRFGGNNMALSPEGFRRFGQLFLNDGRWNGKQVVPEEWVKESTRRYVFDTYHGYPYGYFWWHATYQDVNVLFAWGHGGQFVFILPELDMVVTTTSDLQSVTDTDGYTERVHHLLKTKIIPAVLDEEKQ